jgi:hypothetical protein
MDFPSLVQTGATSMAVLVAAAGAYRMTHAGARFFERTEAKVLQVADTFLETQARITVAQERQAQALEDSANMTALLSHINESQRQTGGTLRVMSRKLGELSEAQEDLRSSLQALAIKAAGSEPRPLTAIAGEPTVPVNYEEKNS